MASNMGATSDEADMLAVIDRMFADDDSDDLDAPTDAPGPVKDAPGPVKDAPGPVKDAPGPVKDAPARAPTRRRKQATPRDPLQPKRPKTLSDDDVALKHLALPDANVMSPTMVRLRNEAHSDLTDALDGIEVHRQKLIVKGTLTPSAINVSTITLECNMLGPVVSGSDMKARLSHPDVAAFNEEYLGKQPLFGGAKNAFNNSHILLLHDLKPKNNMSIKLFHPKPKLHITGPTNVDEFLAVAEYGRRLLTAVSDSKPSPLFMLDSFRVQMINTNFKLGDGRFKISTAKMHDLLTRLAIDVVYDTARYAGLKIKRKSLSSKHAWIMVFESGNVLITSSAGSSILEAYRFITDLVVRNIDVIRLEDDLCG
jgi:hypothetical protein